MRGRKDNIKIHLMEITFKEGFEQTPRRPGPVAGFIEHGKESDSAEATFMARVELFNT